MIKVVVYDCDGVLVDSGNVILSYYNWMMNKCGLPEIDWTEDNIRTQAMSLADKDILELLAKGDRELYERMLNVAKTEPSNISFEEMSIETNLLEGLESIKMKGLPMAVVTNRGKSLTSLLRYFNIDTYFQKLVTANDVVYPKPSPEGLLEVCSFFNVTPSEIVYIGDSPTDYEAARACGADFVAFKKPLGDAPVIFDHKNILKYL